MVHQCPSWSVPKVTTNAPNPQPPQIRLRVVFAEDPSVPPPLWGWCLLASHASWRTVLVVLSLLNNGFHFCRAWKVLTITAQVSAAAVHVCVCVCVCENIGCRFIYIYLFIYLYFYIYLFIYNSLFIIHYLFIYLFHCYTMSRELESLLWIRWGFSPRFPTWKNHGGPEALSLGSQPGVMH